MTDQKTQAAGNGLGCGTVLFLILLTLKLAEVGQVKDWSWWWVTAPLWAPFVVAVVVVTLFVTIAALIGVVTRSTKRLQ